MGVGLENRLNRLKIGAAVGQSVQLVTTVGFVSIA